MPNFFAHYLHGKEVLKNLPKDISANIKNKKLFEIGLQGPDIFYPYKALSFPNTYKVNRLAGKIHRESGRAFLENVFKHTTVKKRSNVFSYLAGFLCHFSLDANCHPYIEKIAKKNKFTHGEVEIEFDRFLLSEKGFDPTKTNLSKMIKPPKLKTKALRAIVKTYKGFKCLNEKKINRSLKDFKFFKRFFYAPTNTKEALLFYVCKVCMLGNIYKSCVIPHRENPNSFISNTGLICLFAESVFDSVSLIENLCAHIEKGAAFSESLSRTFLGD